MNNYERIKAMSIEEMAEFFDENATFFLVKKKFDDFTNDNSIKQWLESEVEDE